MLKDTSVLWNMTVKFHFASSFFHFRLASSPFIVGCRRHFEVLCESSMNVVPTQMYGSAQLSAQLRGMPPATPPLHGAGMTRPNPYPLIIGGVAGANRDRFHVAVSPMPIKSVAAGETGPRPRCAGLARQRSRVASDTEIPS